MSRRLAVDKRPKKQNLQMIPGKGEAAGELRDAEIARRKAEGARPGQGGETSPRPRNPGDRPCLKPGEKDFSRTIQRNAFIDSYYPKLRGDFSEDFENSGKSLSDYSEAVSKIIASDKLEVEDSPEPECRTALKTERTAFAKDATSELLGQDLEHFTERRLKSSHRATLQQSSRSRLTLDSKTYTLFSCASDAEPAVHGTARRAKGPEGGGAAEDQGREASGEGALSTVDWFAQLHRRIQTLEELLQDALVNSFPQKENECSGKAGRLQKARTRKTKFLVPETPKTVGGGVLKLYGSTTDKEKENFDTDNELRNIKKRVRALEMKLREAKMPGALGSDKPSADVRELATLEKSLLLAETRVEKECCCQFANCEESDSTRARPSDAKVFLTDFSPSEKEARHVKTTRKVKKKFMAKYKRIKGMCDSVMSSSTKSSKSNNNNLLDIPKECSILPCKIAEDSLDKAFRRHSFPEHTSRDSRPEGKAARLPCPQESASAAPRSRRKKVRKRRKDLCRKSSITDMGLGGAFGDRGSPRAGCGGRSGDLQGERPASPAVRSSEEEAAKRKGRRKPRPSRNPLNILRRGGQIKIPVLFKEVCKTPKSTELAQKVSGISIRFVLVEKDSKHPLRKLIKKLSMGSSPQRKEQYVFGVSKCCCETEIHQLGTTCGRRDLKNFIDG